MRCRAKQIKESALFFTQAQSRFDRFCLINPVLSYFSILILSRNDKNSDVLRRPLDPLITQLNRYALP